MAQGPSSTNCGYDEGYYDAMDWLSLAIIPPIGVRINSQLLEIATRYPPSHRLEQSRVSSATANAVYWAAVAVKWAMVGLVGGAITAFPLCWLLAHPTASGVAGMTERGSS